MAAAAVAPFTLKARRSVCAGPLGLFSFAFTTALLQVGPGHLRVGCLAVLRPHRAATGTATVLWI